MGRKGKKPNNAAAPVAKEEEAVEEAEVVAVEEEQPTASDSPPVVVSEPVEPNEEEATPNAPVVDAETTPLAESVQPEEAPLQADEREPTTPVDEPLRVVPVGIIEEPVLDLDEGEMPRIEEVRREEEGEGTMVDGAPQIEEDRDAAVEELLEQGGSEEASLHGWSAPNTPEVLPEAAPMSEFVEHEPALDSEAVPQDEQQQPLGNAAAVPQEEAAVAEDDEVAPLQEGLVAVARRSSHQDDLVTPSRRADSTAQSPMTVGEARQLVDDLKQELDSRIGQLQGLMHVEEDETDEKLNLMRDSFQAALLDLHNELHQHLHCGLEAVKVSTAEAAENRTIEEVARLERDTNSKIRNVVDEVRTQWQESLSSSMETMQGKIDDICSKLESDAKEKDKQLQSVTEQLETALNSQNHSLQQLQSQIIQLSTVVETALRAEVLHPPVDIPTEGPRLRVIVTVEACPPSVPASFELMVPISIKATIGVVKREVLRRAANQLPPPTTEAGAPWRYSSTDMLDRNVLLFEEDTLEDIDLQSMAAPRLTLRSRMIPVALPQAAAGKEVLPTPQQEEVASPKKPLLSVTPIATTSTSLRVGGVAESAPSATTEAKNTEQWVPLRFQSLPESVVTSLAEHESLDRRLMSEVCRMELQPILDEERIRRTEMVKGKLHRLRMTLLDRATYSHVESHRRVCRSELDKLDNALNAAATPEEAHAAVRSAEMVLESISSTQGEENRVEALQQAAVVERRRKERLTEDIKDFKFAIQHQLRIPSYLFGEAEKLTFDCDRAAILSATMTTNEMDDLHRRLSDFVDRLKQS